MRSDLTLDSRLTKPIESSPSLPRGKADAHRKFQSITQKAKSLSDNYALIRQAILERRQVVATYDGYVREMCPHTLGTKNGRSQALFFQFAGESSQGLPADGEWRCFVVDRLENLSVRDGGWHTGHRHSQPQSCVDEIDVEVAH
jgi:predicted DNA-binding transcriptional regulator YafY